MRKFGILGALKIGKLFAGKKLNFFGKIANSKIVQAQSVLYFAVKWKKQQQQPRPKNGAKCSQAWPARGCRGVLRGAPRGVEWGAGRPVYFVFFA